MSAELPGYVPDPPTDLDLAILDARPCPACGAPVHWERGLEALLDASLFLSTLSELSGDPETKRRQVVSRIHDEALRWMEVSA